MPVTGSNYLSVCSSLRKQWLSPSWWMVIAAPQCVSPRVWECVSTCACVFVAKWWEPMSCRRKRDQLMFEHLSSSIGTKREEKRYISIKIGAKSTFCVWLFDPVRVFGPRTDWAAILHRLGGGGLTSIHVYSRCQSSAHFTSTNITLHPLISVSSQ